MTILNEKAEYRIVHMLITEYIWKEKCQNRKYALWD